MTKRLRVHLLHEDAKLPTYAHPDDSGMDIYAVKDVVVYSSLQFIEGALRMLGIFDYASWLDNKELLTEYTHSNWTIVPTGISAEVPEGYELQVRSKSGLAASHGIFVLNSPGTIDEGYRGEIKVILANVGYEDYEVKKGQKIAQMVLCPVEKAEIVSMNDFQRGQGGFGSTGV